MRRLATALAALIALGTAASAGPLAYRPDPFHTTVRASWNHIGFSEQALNFREVSGTVALDPADLTTAKVDVAVRIASVDTGVPALDQHLQSADFFDAARFAEARFVSTAVERTGERTARVTGDLTIKGITRPVTLEVTLNAAGEHPFRSFDPGLAGQWIGVTATAVVRRSEFGMGMMVPAISDEVSLFISTEMQARD